MYSKGIFFITLSVIICFGKSVYRMTRRAQELTSVGLIGHSSRINAEELEGMPCGYQGESGCVYIALEYTERCGRALRRSRGVSVAV